MDVAGALLALAVSAFTSATILPGTSEAVLVAMTRTGVGPLWLLFIVATVANVAGSCVNWAMGRFASRLRTMRWFSPSQPAMARAERWFGKWGKWSLLVSWLPIVGDPLTLVAGLLRVPFPVFVTLVSVAKATRYAVVLAVATGF